MRGSRGMRHLALIGGLVAAACCGVAATAMASDTYVAWKRQLGTADDDWAKSLATDAAGNVYLTGSTRGSLGGPFKGGYADAWVTKYAADGHPLWKRQLGTADEDYANGVATDAAGTTSTWPAVPPARSAALIRVASTMPLWRSMLPTATPCGSDRWAR